MFAVICVPNFFLQAVLRLEPALRAGAVALVDAGLNKPVVLQMTASARRAGVVGGLTPSQAMARCEGLVIRNRSVAQEQSAADVLLQTACSFSPNTEWTGPGLCTIDLKGLGLATEPMQRRWASQLLLTLAPLQLDAQIGFGPNPGLALLMAQAAAGGVLLADDPEQFVRRLPLAALDPSPEIAAILSSWGVQTIGAFLDLGKDNVAERLGPAATALFDRLDTNRPLQLAAPPETFVEQVEFQVEIETTEPLLFVLRRILEQLARRLDMIYLVVAELELRLTLASGVHYTKTFKIPAPTNHLQVLFRTLQTHLETLRADAPIIALQLQALPGRCESHQFGLFETTLRDPNQFGETLSRLAALCGHENVGTPGLVSSHRPDAFRMTPPDFSRAATGAAAVEVPRSGLQLRRFRPALAATVEFRGKRPALVRSPGLTGAVQAADGPFLSSGDWWDIHGWEREEWDVEMADGVMGRIFRSAEGCFVDGIYD
jgi:protein ImuB